MYSSPKGNFDHMRVVRLRPGRYNSKIVYIEPVLYRKEYRFLPRYGSLYMLWRKIHIFVTNYCFNLYFIYYGSDMTDVHDGGDPYWRMMDSWISTVPRFECHMTSTLFLWHNYIHQLWTEDYEDISPYTGNQPLRTVFHNRDTWYIDNELNNDYIRRICTGLDAHYIECYTLCKSQYAYYEIYSINRCFKDRPYNHLGINLNLRANTSWQYTQIENYYDCYFICCLQCSSMIVGTLYSYSNYTLDYVGKNWWLVRYKCICITQAVRIITYHKRPTIYRRDQCCHAPILYDFCLNKPWNDESFIYLHEEGYSTDISF